MKFFLTTFVIFSINVFIACESSTNIDFSELQEFYKYIIINYSDGQLKDSLFTTLTISNMRNSDTLKINHGVLDLSLGIGGKLLGIWGIRESGKVLIPETYTFLNKSFSKGQFWSMEKEIGFESGAIERRFTVLSKDTSLKIYNLNIDKILLLEQRDWIDVGGMWSVNLYGFDKLDKLVFMHKFIEDGPWDEKQRRSYKIFAPEKLVVHDSKHTYFEISDYLVLDEFFNSESISENDQEKWEYHNSQEAKEWLSWKTSLKDFIQPPRPKVFSDSDSLLEDVVIEME